MIDPLPGVRAVDRRHPLWWDVGLAVLVAAVAAGVGPRLGFSAAAVFLVVHAAVVFRRRRPLAALLVSVAGSLLAAADALAAGVQPPWVFLAGWVLVFSAALRDGRRAALLAGAASVLLLGVVAVVAPPPVGGPAEQVARVVAVVGTGAAAFLLGLQLRGRRQRIAAEQAEIARAAAVAERVRIAQEMHDVIGHNLSVISALAAGGGVAARTSPDDAVRAFAAIGEVSRSSVQEVRRVLRVLRQDGSAEGAPLRPLPGVAEIPALVASVRSAGGEVELVQSGDLRGLGVGRERTVYRIVQEALTNVLRHAGPAARARVAIVREADAVVVTVSDDGGASGAGGGGRSAETPGHGLVGMRERVEAFAGSLDAGPAGAGWRVRARLPLDDEREAA